MITNIKQHLSERHINLELHRPIIDEVLGVCSFLLYNFSGQIVGYQQYNPNGSKKIFNDKLNGRYYTYRNKKHQAISLWGLESFYQSTGAIFLTEGIFDSARLTNIGRTSFATLCNSPPKEYRNWLKMLNRPIIAICDNDSAGLMLSEFSDYYEIVPSKDLGDAPDEYIDFLIKTYP